MLPVWQLGASSFTRTLTLEYDDGTGAIHTARFDVRCHLRP